jgi:hypothetical protein
MKSFSLAFAAIAICLVSQTARATEIGVFGKQTWTSQEKLVSPLGIGVFVSQELSRRMRLQLEYDYGFERQRFVQTFYRGMPPLRGDTIRDFWTSKAWVRSAEISFLYSALKREGIRLEAGTGLEILWLDASITGTSTGYRFLGTDAEKLGISFLVNVRVDSPLSLPLRLHLGFRQRYAAAEAACDDCYGLFDSAFKASEVRMGLSIPF